MSYGSTLLMIIFAMIHLFGWNVCWNRFTFFKFLQITLMSMIISP